MDRQLSEGAHGPIIGLRLSACPKVLTFGFNGDHYQSEVLADHKGVRLKMQNVDKVEYLDQNFQIDTGSPHYVSFFDEVESIQVAKEGAKIRYNDVYRDEGINVNFCSFHDGQLHVRTYERGVEDETYSCGTGVVASAIAYSLKYSLTDGKRSVPISTLGGKLRVEFYKKGEHFTDIYLQGPAIKVFEGTFEYLA